MSPAEAYRVVPFPPSAVDLCASFPPLVGAMRQSESEAAATVLLRALARGGDIWRAATMQECGSAIESDLDAKRSPLHDLRTNPFWRPDFRALAASGYAVLTDNPATAEFTQAGIGALRRYVSEVK